MENWNDIADDSLSCAPLPPVVNYERVEEIDNTRTGIFNDIGRMDIADPAHATNPVNPVQETRQFTFAGDAAPPVGLFSASKKRSADEITADTASPHSPCAEEKQEKRQRRNNDGTPEFETSRLPDAETPKAEASEKDRSPVKTQKASPKPLTAERISKRRKQVQFGKNTEGYKLYAAAVAKSDRIPFYEKHPTTPDARLKISKRSWLGQVKKWRRQLHKWDNEEDAPESAEKGEPTERRLFARVVGGSPAVHDVAEFPPLEA